MTNDTEIRPRRLLALACTVALGLASGIGVAACGEDRGGVEVLGGGTTAGGTTAGGTTPTATTP